MHDVHILHRTMTKLVDVEDSNICPDKIALQTSYTLDHFQKDQKDPVRHNSLNRERLLHQILNLK